MCTYITAQDNAQYGGIPIQASSSVTLPTAPILFQINGNAKIGGKDMITKTLYFIIIDDNTPVITGSTAALS